MKNQHTPLKTFRKWTCNVPALALLGWLVVNCNSSGQQLTWDPNGNQTDGSGTWTPSGTTWYNGSSDVAGAWTTGGSITNGATLGFGTAGTYTVDLAGNNILLTNLTFNTSGYAVESTVAGGTLSFAPLPGTTPSAYNFINVAAGVSATISAAISNSYTANNSQFVVGTGGTLTLAGGGNFAGNTVTSGKGTVDFNSGTYGGGNFVLEVEANTTQEAATLNLARLIVAYGVSVTDTINSASAVVNGSGSGGNNVIGRSGSVGLLDLKQGAINFTHSGNDMRLAYDANSQGILNIEGGTFNDGANNTYINWYGTGATGSGTLNISGGTYITGSIMFGGGIAGGANAYVSGSTAMFKMTGGNLYVGAGGINVNSANTGTLNSSAYVSGGIIGATNSAWTSGLNMVLGTTNGNITFQAADSAGVAHNITLNGALSGTGGLNTSGAGIVTLGGVNTYAGNTTVEAGGTLVLANTGHLSFEIGANGINNQVNGTGGLTLNGTLDINLAGADSAAGDLWDLIADSNVTYGSGFNLTGFTDNDGIWTDTANGTTYEYNQSTGDLTTISATPEPSMVSTAILSGLGMAFIFRRRR